MTNLIRLVVLTISVYSFSAAAEILHCRIEPTGYPMSYMEYDASTRTVWTLTGWPQKWTQFTNVKVKSGLPPYYNKGNTLVAFDDAPIIHISKGADGYIWYERDSSYNWGCRWGVVPGAPRAEPSAGVCWVTQE